jgi:hypothetical protein
MLDFVDGCDIAAEVILVRAASRKSIVLVEGRTDFNLFINFFDAESVYTLVAHGRQRVIAALETLNEETIAGYVGIVDADFWHIDRNFPDIENIVVTDHHDIEVLMIFGNTTEQIFREYGSREKISGFLQRTGCHSCEDWLFSQAEFLGRLRLVSYRAQLRLKFEDLNFKKFVSRDTLLLDTNVCLSRVLLNSPNIAVTHREVEALLNELPAQLDNRQLCSGHDLLQIMAIGLRKVWGTQEEKLACEENLGKVLRLAYSFEKFSATALYESLRAWERENAPFKLF